MIAQEADRQIDLWLNIIAGDGMTDADLFKAAVALRLAARAKRAANTAAGVTLHSTARDGKTVENTDAATTGN